MNVCIIGMGYIGLPTAGLFARNGLRVIGVDIDRAIVDRVNNGNGFYAEPGIKELLKEGVKAGNLTASLKPSQADIFIITVQTPLKDGRPDLSYVKSATESILPFLENGNLIILESTVRPGTTEELVLPLLQKTGKTLHLAYCPERVIPGAILKELIENDRVIGGINKPSAILAAELYRRICKGELFLTDCKTAETAKLMENTYRDVNIALANRLAVMAEELKINAWEIIRLANKHPRVKLHLPGPGVGGHCIAIDPLFLSDSVGSSPLIDLSRKINNSMPDFVTEKIFNILKGIQNPVVTILGLSYKGNTGDRRESPSFKIIRKLAEKNIQVNTFDPYICGNNLQEAVKGSDLIVIVTDHREFKSLVPGELGPLMRHRIVYDTRNIIYKREWQEAGFEYYLLGDGRQV